MQFDERVHFRLENLYVNGFVHKVHGPGRISHKRFIVARRNENNGDVLGSGPFFDQGGGLVAVQAGHARVHDDDREILVQNLAQRVLAGIDADKRVPQRRKKGLIGKDVFLNVVHDQDIDRGRGIWMIH